MDRLERFYDYEGDTRSMDRLERYQHLKSLLVRIVVGQHCFKSSNNCALVDKSTKFGIHI